MHGVEGDDWDARYSDREHVQHGQLWSGQPNGALVAEVSDLHPGRVLDVGCGEGADAIWLAKRGWDVTAIDVSAVALDRARSAAQQEGASVQWLHAGLLAAALPTQGFDLVSAQYPALRRTPGDDAERAMIDVVAPGGTLLVVHHADRDLGSEHGFDPADYVSPADVAALLDERWEVALEDRRPRTISGGAGAHHRDDVVLRARRRD